MLINNTRAVSALANEMAFEKLTLNYEYYKSIFVESGLAYSENTISEDFDGNELVHHILSPITKADVFNIREGGNTILDEIAAPILVQVAHRLITNLRQKPISGIYVNGSMTTERVKQYLKSYVESALNSVLTERDKTMLQLLFYDYFIMADPSTPPTHGWPDKYDPDDYTSWKSGTYSQRVDFTSTASSEDKAMALLRDLELYAHQGPSFIAEDSQPVYVIGPISYIKEYFYALSTLKNGVGKFNSTVHSDGTVGLTNMFTSFGYKFVGVPDGWLWKWEDSFNNEPDYSVEPVEMPVLITKRDALFFSVPKIKKEPVFIDGTEVPSLAQYSSTKASPLAHESQTRNIHDALTKKFMDSDLCPGKPLQFGANTLDLIMEPIATAPYTAQSQISEGLYLRYKTYCAAGVCSQEALKFMHVPPQYMHSLLPGQVDRPVTPFKTQGHLIDKMSPGAEGEFTHPNGETEIVSKTKDGKTKSYAKSEV
jgi:hypothetical protein